MTTIQDHLDEIENKLNQADDTSDLGDVIIAVEQLKLVLEAVIRLQGIDTEQPIDSGEKV